MNTTSDGLFRICQDYDSDDNSSDVSRHPENQTGCKDDDIRNGQGNALDSRLAAVIPSSILQMFNEGKEHSESTTTPEANYEGSRVSLDRGKWQTYIYVPLPSRGLLDVVINDLVNAAKLVLPAIERITEEELHISLSRNVHVDFHFIQPLMNDIKAAIKRKKRFSCCMSSIAVYPNDDYTRTFLAIEIYGGYDQLRSLANSINGCFKKFQLPPFYEPPSFHISIGWCPGNRLNDFNQSIITQLQTKLEEHLEDLNPIVIEHLECKCGNKLYVFPLEL